MPEQRDDRERFDPRFDPAFQPGYDGDADRPARTDQGAYGRRAAPAADDRFAPSSSGPPAPPAYGGVPAAYSPAPSRAPIAGGEDTALQLRADQPTSGESGTDTHPVAATNAEAPVRGPNPFSIALWVISALLIVGGITIYRSLPGLFADGQADASAGNSFIQLFALGVLAAILIGVGLVAAIGNLVMLAARFDRRR